MHIIVTFPRRVAIQAAVFLLLVGTLSPLLAQPMLTFKRVTVNWPTIELYFAAGCDGSPAYSMTKDNFRIRENGEDVEAFTLWCPDPSARCAVSMAVVLDVSGSMSGAPFDRIRSGAHAMVDVFDGVIDEMTIVASAADVFIPCSMTTVKPQLHACIDALRSGGASRIWDAVDAGLDELIRAGTNQCRALLLFSDGGDLGSAITISDIIAKANRNRIRIFTISEGAHTQHVALEMIAVLTGGRYYQTPNASQMAAIYTEISSILFQGFQECIVTYERGCPDGSVRTVEMQLVDFCGGTDVKSKTYRAPLDSTSFARLNVRIPWTRAPLQQETRVPVLLSASLPVGLPQERLGPFEMHLSYDASITPVRIEAGPGNLLHQQPYTVQSDPGRLLLRSTAPLNLRGWDTLCTLLVEPFTLMDSAATALRIDSMVISEGCLLPQFNNAPVTAVVRLLPFITPSATGFCEGDHITLHGNEGFAAYLWSTGERTRSITVTQGGSYGLRVIDASGDTLDADPVTIAAWPRPRVRITADGPLTFCRGKSRKLTVTGDTAGCSVRWSNNQRDKSTNVNTAGLYWAIVTSANGCAASTDTVEILIDELTVTVLPGTDVALCPGDSVVFSVDGTFRSVKWWGLVQPTYTVHWTKDRVTTRFYVEVIDSAGCDRRSDWITVTMLPRRYVGIFPARDVSLCRGKDLTLTADAGFVDYRWSTGATGRELTVNTAGSYHVVVTDSSGCAHTSAAVNIALVDAPQPRIVMSAPPRLCGPGGITLDAGADYEGYEWSNGASTRTIVVHDSGEYWVRVTAFGGCSALSDTVRVTWEDAVQRFIPVVRGSLPICPGDTVWLDAPANMDRYVWNTGEYGSSIAVTKEGSYFVTILTLAGCEAVSEEVFVPMRRVVKPVITRGGDFLSSTNAQGWQWYRNNSPIPGATQRSHRLMETGVYTVSIVDSAGCHVLSDPFTVTVLDNDALSIPDQLILYPDPATDRIHVRIPGPFAEATVALYSLLGQHVHSERASGGESRVVTLATGGLPRGVYIVRVTAGDRMWTRRVVLR